MRRKQTYIRYIKVYFVLTQILSGDREDNFILIDSKGYSHTRGMYVVSSRKREFQL